MVGNGGKGEDEKWVTTGVNGENSKDILETRDTQGKFRGKMWVNVRKKGEMVKNRTTG